MLTGNFLFVKNSSTLERYIYIIPGKFFWVSYGRNSNGTSANIDSILSNSYFIWKFTMYTVKF